MTQPHPQPFNRTSFITLNNSRLFTARQVADLIKEHTLATPSMEYTIEQIAEIDNRIRKERKAEREQVIQQFIDLAMADQWGAL